MNSIATFRTDPSNGFLNNKWRANYEGVSRANSVLSVLATMPEGELSEDEASNIEGQAKFLRGHFYFDLKKMFGHIPWIDETITRSEEHTSELQSLMRISYAVFCLKKKKIRSIKHY